MVAACAFVHLHVHTEFSLVDGIVRIKPLVAAVAAADMPAVAVTDQGNLFGMVKFYRAARAAGVKPIVGADVFVEDPENAAARSRMLLLCRNENGYRTLARLLSRGYGENRLDVGPCLRMEWLADNADLLACCGGPHGLVGSRLLAGDDTGASRFLDRLQVLFADRFYLQVQRTGRPDEERHLHSAVAVALKHGVPIIAGNDVRFITADDFEAHEARVCIHEGRTLADSRRPRHYSEQQYLRTVEEMHALFSDLPEALENTLEVAKRCNLSLNLDENYLPDFPVPAGQTLEEWFDAQSRSGLDSRLSVLFSDSQTRRARRPEYEERLRIELDVIKGMGFPGYFLIVADFIHWARGNGVPVGPGRGSGAGSLVAYSLGITDLDPIQYDLLFERFLNPERVSLPDFDIDFCMEGRDRVIDYVADRYGRDHVAQIITFGTMAAKAVVRDVGRVMGQPFGFVDQIAKMIPFEIGITLDKALADEEGFKARYDDEDDVKELIDLARKLEGIARNAGRHAGGVVIAPSKLTDFTPLYCEQGSQGLVTQFDKDDVEAIGLVKFDFLGLKTLTIIEWAVADINRGLQAEGAALVDIATLPTVDEATYALVQKSATVAVFQLESRGMRELIKNLRPDCFEDVIALVALFRPGPLQSGMVDDFIDRKHGRARVVYPHPDLEPILKPTYGVILYQEQVMQIAQVLAGYTLGGADLLRRAMGKKKPEEMAKQREIFLAGSEGRGVDQKVASGIFDLMEKFAGYGFNKSHSAAYALVAYQTAWLKCHYPAPFMAAVLTADTDNTDKIVGFVDECRRMRLKVLPPDINTCEIRFRATADASIQYGLGAIKGVGATALEAILSERRRAGVFHDLFDFCRRVDARSVTRRILEAMTKAGAMDALGPSRSALMASLTGALQAAEQVLRDAAAGQNDMFGGVVNCPGQAARFAAVNEWTDTERLFAEKETLGLYLTGHPITVWQKELDNIVTARLGQFRVEPDRTQIAAGLVLGLRTMNSRRGRMAVLTLDDGSGRMEAVLYSDVYQRCRGILAKDKVLIVSGEVNADDFTGGPSMTVENVYDLDRAREAFARCICLRVTAQWLSGEQVEHFKEALQPFRDGRTPVFIHYRNRDAEVRVPLGRAWRVRPANELLQRLEHLTAPGLVTTEY